MGLIVVSPQVLWASDEIMPVKHATKRLEESKGLIKGQAGPVLGQGEEEHVLGAKFKEASKTQ